MKWQSICQTRKRKRLIKNDSRIIWLNNGHIRYRPLWETMSQKKVTTYTLRVKHGMSHATVQRLQADQPVSTHTLNKLCEILNCRLDEVAEYVPDDVD